MGVTESNFRGALLRGMVIPAHPLALNARRELDERRQRALTRYYAAAGAGGVAVGVHTTQFAIRKHGLYAPVLQLAAECAAEVAAGSGVVTPPPHAAEETGLRGRMVLIAGAVGDTRQAVGEAEIAASLGYDAVLLSLGGGEWAGRSESQILAHCRAVGEVLPLFGFYLQPAVGGRVLSWSFWRELAEFPSLVAVKIAPFNRYQSVDVVRAIVESGRDDVALYTGNDDSIVSDLVTPFRFRRGGEVVERYMSGGLLGQWAVWTSRAVEILEQARKARGAGAVPADLLALGARLTDANGAIFDAANSYAGCIPGIHEVLRRQGVLAGRWCLDTRELLSAGQEREITRVLDSYPDLADDSFVAENLASWLS